MLKIRVNSLENNEQVQEYDVKAQKDGYLLNGETFDWDLIELKEGTFHVIKNKKSYQAEVIKADYDEKTFVIQVNEQAYEVAVKDRFDALLKSLGMDRAASTKVSNVKAPMPGLILDIKIEEGAEVKKGDVLMILEAMKMENVLKSPADGTIKDIKIKQGDNVEKNQVLIDFA